MPDPIILTYRDACFSAPDGFAYGPKDQEVDNPGDAMGWSPVPVPPAHYTVSASWEPFGLSIPARLAVYSSGGATLGAVQIDEGTAGTPVVGPTVQTPIGPVVMVPLLSIVVGPSDSPLSVRVEHLPDASNYTFAQCVQFQWTGPDAATRPRTARAIPYPSKMRPAGWRWR